MSRSPRGSPPHAPTTATTQIGSAARSTARPGSRPRLRAVRPSPRKPELFRSLSRGCSTTSLRSPRRCWRSWRQGWLDRPLDEVPRPPLRGVARLPLPAAEIERLVAACRDAEELLLILLASDAGLRRVEISRLRRGDVELGEGWHDGVYGWISAEGKRGRRRSVPVLTPALRDALVTVCRFRRAPEDQLFRWSGVGSTSHVAAAIAERAGLGRRCLLHRMRHYWITAIRSAGEVGPVTMARSGHAGTAVHDRYTHPALNPTRDLRDALRRGGDDQPERPDWSQDGHKGGSGHGA
ncbi:MAG: tyrosine-type recombinase/integrase [Candidatus Polarisedimenticolia bacterium]